MSLPLVWMADVLRAAGCAVVEEPGWKTRGRPRAFDPIGIMLHHDASPAGETSNGADVIVNGRPGLSGPLGNLWLSYDGAWHCIAAGSANHAGEGDGSWGDIDDGNHDTIGIETDHTTDEKWTGGQRSSGLRGIDALRRRLGMTDAQVARRVLAHKEWAPSRKIDPDPMDMDRARAQLLAFDPTQEDGFVEQIRLRVRIGEEDDPSGPQFGAVNGPCHFLLDMYLTTDGGIAPGKSMMLRGVNTDGDPDNVVAQHPIMQYGPTDTGSQHHAYSTQGWLPEGQTLRVQANTDDTVRITKTETRVTTW
jgi:hypothetical protein